jgi:hypothetical protein
MRVYLDEKPCELDAPSVGDAIAACAAMAEDHGRFVVEIMVDGKQWTSEQLERANLTTATADEVRLITAQPADLVAQTFAEAATALDDARTLQDDAAALLQQDDQAAAMGKLGEAFTIWMSVQQAVVQGSQLVNLDLDQCSIEECSAQQVISELSTRLQSLRDQLTNRDHVGVADTLLYELPEVINQWQRMLEILQQHVQEA